MADVVRMEKWLSRRTRNAPAQRDTPAQVLLFTGVRYERLTPAMIAASQRGALAGKHLGKGPDTARRP